MTFSFTTDVPTKEIREELVLLLNMVAGVSATGEFITEIPRHNKITVTIDNPTTENIFEIGRLVGQIDN